MKKFSLFLISVIFILGFLLRAQEAISGNFLFLIDQGRDLMDVKGIVFDHKLTLIGPYTSLGGVFQGPIWYYLLSVPIFITNGDPHGTVVLMLIISMAVLFSVFIFMRKYFGLLPAVITCALFAFSPEAIAAATFSWNPHPMWLIITLYIFMLYLTVSKNVKNHLFLWPLIALSFHFETALGVFLGASTLIYFLVFKRKLVKSKFFYIGILISLLFFLPQIIFDIRHDFLMSRSIIEIFQGENRGLFSGGENTSYLNLISDHIMVFYNNYVSSFIHDGYLLRLPNFVLVFIALMLVKLRKGKLLKKHEKEFLHVNISIVTIIILLSFVYPFPIRSWFLTGFQSFYLVITGLLLYKALSFKLGKVLIVLLVLIVLVYVVPRIYMLYFTPPDYGGTAKIKGKIDAIDYIYRDAKGDNFGLFIFTPPINTDSYDYLLWWYGRSRYSYLPHSQKKGVFYLLIEPDSAQPWTYKGWLETVIKNGEVINTKTLPSGLIIQKRRI